MAGDKHKSYLAASRQSLGLASYLTRTQGQSPQPRPQPMAPQSTPSLSETSQPSEGSSSCDQSIPDAATTTSSQSVNNFTTKTNTLTAEIWWSLKTIDSNFSFSSNSDLNFVLNKMFPDEQMISNFKCGETKSMYISIFGLAPYFQRILVQKVKREMYVLLFDESFNSEIKKKQMDFMVRYWDGDTVVTRYFDSKFLGHATADDMLTACHECVQSKIGYQHLLQVSMDGLNVNWSFFKKFNEQMKRDFELKLINIVWYSHCAQWFESWF
jgi:hypothetical protein